MGGERQKRSIEKEDKYNEYSDVMVYLVHLFSFHPVRFYNYSVGEGGHHFTLPGSKTTLKSAMVGHAS